MKLLSLQLKNFRTYESLQIDFASRLSFITGPNANGKTNILEAIGMLSLGKSFRGAADEDMVRRDAAGYYIECRYEKDGQAFDINLGVDHSGKKVRRRIRLNGKQLPGRSALIGQIISVIFSPQDIMIAEGGPAYRRRFLDMVLSYQNQDYLKQLLQYNRALRQRNAILKKMKSGKARLDQLSAWDGPIVDYATRITRARQTFVTEFEVIFQDALRRISGDIDSLSMRLAYASDLEAEDFATALKKYGTRDAALGYTSVGPHRQNLLFERDGLDIMRFGSQGQKRSLVLALRIAQFSFLQKSLRLAPVLLIDDVIRELDAKRRAAFVELLKECGQAIFTTPDLDGLDAHPDLKKDIAVFHVSSPGQVQMRAH